MFILKSHPKVQFVFTEERMLLCSWINQKGSSYLFQLIV